MKTLLQPDRSQSRKKSIGLFLLLLALYALPATAQQINPQITSSGGELQQGGFGELFSTIGEPLAADSMVVNASSDEATWTGFWQIIPHSPASGVSEEWAPFGSGANAITTAAPNPFSEELQVYVRLESPGHVRLTAYDMLGREAQVLIDGPREAGTTRLRWNPETLDAGAYILKLEIDGTDYPATTVHYVK